MLCGGAIYSEVLGPTTTYATITTTYVTTAKQGSCHSTTPVTSGFDLPSATSAWYNGISCLLNGLLVCCVYRPSSTGFVMNSTANLAVLLLRLR